MEQLGTCANLELPHKSCYSCEGTWKPAEPDAQDSVGHAFTPADLEGKLRELTSRTKDAMARQKFNTGKMAEVNIALREAAALGRSEWLALNHIERWRQTANGAVPASDGEWVMWDDVAATERP